MHSSKSVSGDSWNPEHQNGDGVLNVDHISKYGNKLGGDVTEFTIDGGLHDLILSKPEVRENAYAQIFNWLKTNSF
jgi:alpha-beta hydrolase superfamily lysophospholipase